MTLGKSETMGPDGGVCRLRRAENERAAAPAFWDQDRERANIAIEAAAYVVGTNNLIFLVVFVILATLLPVPAL